MNKENLRKNFIAKRLLLNQTDYEQHSQMVCNRLFALFNFEQFSCVHLFLPILKQKELDTFKIVRRLAREYPHVKTVVPVSQVHRPIMESAVYTPQTVLGYNQWGIPEPEQPQWVAPEHIDMILVPLLAFDQHGHRVGYGKGYYDRYIERLPSSCTIVGLSLFAPVPSIQDVGPFDKPLQYCITPFETHSFKR